MSARFRVVQFRNLNKLKTKTWNSGPVVVTEIMDRGMKFIGRARCKPTDKFDYDIGAEISKSRARILVLQNRRKILGDSLQLFDGVVKILRHRIDSCNKKIAEEKQHIREVIETCETSGLIEDDKVAPL